MSKPFFVIAPDMPTGPSPWDYESAPLHIVVTAEDIKRGKRGQAYYCPIARAVRRATRKRYVEVTAEMIATADWRVTPPQKAIDFIDRYDVGQPVEPIEFDIHPW